MDKKLLQNSPRPYALVLLCGLLAGAVTRLTGLLPAGGLWGFSSIATLYGFRVLSVTVIVLLSSGPLCAGACSFLYLFAMTLSFYGLQPLLGQLLPQWFQPEFKTSLFLLYTALSACAGLGALLGFWQRIPGRAARGGPAGRGPGHGDVPVGARHLFVPIFIEPGRSPGRGGSVFGGLPAIPAPPVGAPL